jgi:hypothetical protein
MTDNRRHPGVSENQDKAFRILKDARMEFLEAGKSPYSAACGVALWEAAVSLAGPTDRGPIAFGLILEADSSLGEWDVVVREITDAEATAQAAAWLMRLSASQLQFFVGALAWEYVGDPDPRFWRTVERLRAAGLKGETT